MEKEKFSIMKNGYNRYQVDDYIQKKENEIDALQKKIDVMKHEKEQLSQEFQFLDDKYCKLNDNLQVKEKAASEMARIAMKEANMIVDTANQNADTIIKEALMMARGILLEVARLGNEANDVKKSMKEELRKIEEVLDDFETPSIPNMDILKKEF